MDFDVCETLSQHEVLALPDSQPNSQPNSQHDMDFSGCSVFPDLVLEELSQVLFALQCARDRLASTSETDRQAAYDEVFSLVSSGGDTVTKFSADNVLPPRTASCTALTFVMVGDEWGSSFYLGFSDLPKR